MKIDKKQIDHIAGLARLKLTDEEKDIYSNQLSDVLDYMDQLKEVDVDSVEPTAQITGTENVMRDDTIDGWSEDEIKNSLNQALARENSQVKTKRILN